MTATRTTRRLILLALILATVLALFVFSAEAGPLPPRKTQPTWPPSYPSRYYCHRANPNPPTFCARYGR